MSITVLIALALAAVCAAGWIMAELDLRATLHDLDAAEQDLDIALGWQEAQLADTGVVRPTLGVIDGGAE